MPTVHEGNPLVGTLRSGIGRILRILLLAGLLGYHREAREPHARTPLLHQNGRMRLRRPSCESMECLVLGMG